MHEVQGFREKVYPVLQLVILQHLLEPSVVAAFAIVEDELVKQLAVSQWHSEFVQLLLERENV